MMIIIIVIGVMIAMKLIADTNNERNSDYSGDDDKE